MRAGALLVLFALLLWPATGRAWDFSIKGKDFALDVTNTFKYGYHFDNDGLDLGDPSNVRKLDEDDDKYHDIFNSLDVSLSHGDYRIGGRFDLNIFANTPFDQHCPDTNVSWCLQQAGRRYENDFRAERLFLVVAKPDFDLTIGDYYASFGKGMALNMVKIDSLGQDTAIRGGKLQIHTGNLGITLLGGTTNPQDVDRTTGYSAGWSDRPVLGARIEYNLFEKVLVGTHGVATNLFIRDTHSESTFGSFGSRADLVWGAGFDVPDLADGRLSLSGEVDLKSRGENEESGIAAYASSSLTLGDLCVLGEFKYYDEYQLINRDKDGAVYDILYNQPPTLERITAEIHDNTNIGGGRLRVDYTVGQLGPVETAVFVNMGYFENWNDDDSRILNPFGGVELQWMDGVGHLEVAAGVRIEHITDADTTLCSSGESPPCLHYQDIHTLLSLEQGFLDKHSIKASFLLLDRKERDILINDSWFEARAEISYKWSPYLSLGYVYEYQGDPTFVNQRTAHYHMGIARYFFTASSYIEVKVGESKPGLKCLNGVCRNFPPFAGAELTGVVRF